MCTYTYTHHILSVLFLWTTLFLRGIWLLSSLTSSLPSVGVLLLTLLSAHSLGPLPCSPSCPHMRAVMATHPGLLSASSEITAWLKPRVFLSPGGEDAQPGSDLMATIEMKLNPREQGQSPEWVVLVRGQWCVYAPANGNQNLPEPFAYLSSKTLSYHYYKGVWHCILATSDSD